MWASEGIGCIMDLNSDSDMMSSKELRGKYKLINKSLCSFNTDVLYNKKSKITPSES